MANSIQIVKAYSIRTLSTAILMIAITFTLSCSSGDDNNGGGESSSSSGGGSLLGYCDYGGGACDPVYTEDVKTLCQERFNFVASCPEPPPPASSATTPSSSAVASSSSKPSSSSVAPTSGTFKDSRDDRTYKWVKIGTQTWMAENLKYGCSGSGECMYSWVAAMNIDSKYSTTRYSAYPKHKGSCPSDWHIPSDTEWDALMSYVEKDKGCTSCAGKYLKAKSGWDEGGNGLDSYGFSALPVGFAYSDGSFGNVGSFGYWWSASEGNNADSAAVWYMGFYLEYMFFDNFDKSRFYNVRCIQD